jgi:hypothetical protein
LSGHEFHLLRPLVASLVRHGQLRAQALDVFDRRGASTSTGG